MGTCRSDQPPIISSIAHTGFRRKVQRRVTLISLEVFVHRDSVIFDLVDKPVVDLVHLQAISTDARICFRATFDILSALSSDRSCWVHNPIKCSIFLCVRHFDRLPSSDLSNFL